MKTVIALIIMVVMVLSLATTVGFAVQTKSFEQVGQQVNRGSQLQVSETDRYWREKARADEKHRVWEDNDRQLEEHIANLPSCSRDAAKIIAQIRDLAFESFDAQKSYYDTWLRDYQGDLSKLHDVMQQRGGLRRGMETDLAEANQELISLLERRRALEVSAAAAKVR